MKLINLHRISYFMLKTARCQFSFMFKLPDAYLSLADVDWKRKGLITGFHMCWHQHFLGDALELCDIQVEPGKSVPSRFRVEQMGFKFRPVTHLIQHTESTPPSVLSFVSSAVSQTKYSAPVWTPIKPSAVQPRCCLFMMPGHKNQSADYKLCRSMCSSMREAQCLSLDLALVKLALLQSLLRTRLCSKGAAALLWLRVGEGKAGVRSLWFLL